MRCTLWLCSNMRSSVSQLQANPKLHGGKRWGMNPCCLRIWISSFTVQYVLISTQEQSHIHLILLAYFQADIPLSTCNSPLLLWLFYHFKFFMLECYGINLGRAEPSWAYSTHTHTHYSYLDEAPAWLCPGPSVGFRSSISAICAFLRPSVRAPPTPKRLAFLWNNQGMVPRAFSWQWCALTLTKPGEKKRASRKLGRKQLHLQCCGVVCSLCRIQETAVILRPANRVGLRTLYSWKHLF